MVALHASPSALALRVAAAGEVGLRPGSSSFDLGPALSLARELGAALPPPGQGQTLALWEALASLGAFDLTVARVVEPHLDALAILGEARSHGQPRPDNLPEDAVWGVFAAEGPQRLHAVRTSAEGWTLHGEKPWCSLARCLSHALVTAWVDEAHRGLFVVDLNDEAIQTQRNSTPWSSRGLAAVESTGLSFTDAAGEAVGIPGWYLERPGFAWGGAGVAAIWYGGAVAVARRLRAAARERVPDQLGATHLGAVDAALTRARATLVQAAAVADHPGTSPEEASRVAQRVRQVVADAAEEVLTRTGHALGPAPLALEEEHARRVADLTIYLRQHHAERDQARLGQAVLGERAPQEWCWW